jgi:hypothetical protein
MRVSGQILENLFWPAEGMGGTLLVESEVGRGSRFVVELPLELATESETYGVELTLGAAIHSGTRPTGMAHTDCRRRP